MNRIAIVAATQREVNPLVVYWIDKMIFCFPNRLKVYENKSAASMKYKSHEVKKIEMDAELFDLSRYNSAIHSSMVEEEILILFNDTLGHGRKISIFLIIFLLISCFRIMTGKADIAGPVDTDQHGSWLCPYFLVGRKSILRTMNFTRHANAEAKVSQQVKNKIENWIETDWRQSTIASPLQKSIKKRTLYLERFLVAEIKNDRLIRFERTGFLRKANALCGSQV